MPRRRGPTLGRLRQDATQFGRCPGRPGARVTKEKARRKNPAGRAKKTAAYWPLKIASRWLK